MVSRHLSSIYMAAFCICISEMILGNSAIVSPIIYHSTLVYLFCAVLLLIKIIYDNYKLIDYFIIVILFIMMLFIAYHSADIIIFVSFLLIIGAKNISFKKIMKWFFYIVFIITSLLVLSSLIGIIPNVGVPGHSLTRYSLGFNYPVALSENVLILSIVYTILHKHIRWLRIGILLILAIFIIIIPNTRMDFYGMIMLIILTFVKKVKPGWINKFPFTLSWLSLPIMSIISVCFAYFFNTYNSFFFNVNHALEGRLYLSHYWLTIFTPSFFGRNISVYSQILAPDGIIINSYIDQSMIKMIVVYGVGLFVIFLLTYMYKMFKLNKFGYNYYVLLFFILVFRGFFDVSLITIIGDPLLLILCASLSTKKGIKYLNENA